MKTQILEAIGEVDLNRSAQIGKALAANERIKYYLSLIQQALAQADHPERNSDLLRRERVTTDIDDRTLDDLVAQARREDGRYSLPGYGLVMEQIVNELRVMAAPVLAQAGSAAAEYAKRAERVLAGLPRVSGDLVERSGIDKLTSASQGEADSVHRLVMDLHKMLNSMQAELAEEHLDGASVYHIEDADRPIIAAFMAGVNRTAPLKFSHPGLSTTATRAGERLIIQNDLGTTDAHVIVIHVEGTRAQITHTDIHPERIQFLRETLKRYAVSWGAEENKRADSVVGGAPFYLVTGSFNARDSTELLEYVEFLGSHLVFLIDWNRARKELRGFLRGKDRIALLGWAAEAEVGHRGFLELGGAQLINRAIEDTAGSAMHFGDRLCDVLGDEAAIEFIRFVFQATAEGLRDHQSQALIQDRLRAELQAHFRSEGKHLFQLASEQAAMIFEIATLVQEGVRSMASGDRGAQYRQLARRARVFEHRADQLVVASREVVRRRPEYTMLFRLLETADNAADELEEVAFLMDLLVASDPEGGILEELAGLADMLVEAAQEWVKTLSHGSNVDKASRVGAQDEIRDFLTAVDALFVLEHRADDADRALTYAAIQNARDFRQLHLYSKMAGSLEEASDALKWAGLMARDYLLGNVLST
jgi:uncharacterized protein Yka (UPF0111/DUF47 family)